jgi:exopolysaccharide production protein ExoZ
MVGAWMSKNQNKLQSIQIFRGLAASAIVLLHSIQAYLISVNQQDLLNQYIPLAAGVDVFFVISGFVMMMVSDSKTGRERNAITFLANRVARVVPTYWLYTVTLAIAGIIVPSIFRNTVVNHETILKSLFFIPYFRTENMIQPILLVGWTLNYEMLFYLIFAMLIGFSSRNRIIAMAAIFICLFIVGLTVYPETAIGKFLSSSLVFEFVSGMVIYAVYRTYGSPAWFQSLAAFGLAVLVFSWIGIDGLGSEQTRFLEWGVPSLLMVYAGLGLPTMAGMVVRFFERLGDWSYSIYLTHLIVIGVLIKIWTRIGGEVGLGFVILAVVVSLIAGAVLYRVIEQPLLRASRRLISRLSAARATRREQQA